MNDTLSASLATYWSLLAHYLAAIWPRVTILGLLLLGSIGLELAGPQILRSFVDSAAAGQEISVLARQAILFAGVAVVGQVLFVGSAYLGEDVGWTATNHMRVDLFSHALGLDLSFHKKHTPGEMTERLDGDVTALAGFFSQLVVTVATSALLLSGILVVLFVLDWRVGLPLTSLAILTLVVLYRLRHFTVDRWKLWSAANANLFGSIEERLVGIEDLRANNGIAYAMRRVYEISQDRYHHARQTMRSQLITTNTAVMLFVICGVAGLAAGIYLYEIGRASLGSVFMIFSYSQMLATPIQRINFQVAQLQQAGGSIKRVAEIAAERSALVDGTRSISEAHSQAQSQSQSQAQSQSHRRPPAIRFENVSFAYDSDGIVLDRLSFSIQPGEVLGVLGRTGGGKSTIARLLFRLYDPTEGAIYFDDLDARQIRLADLRQRVGLVTQDVQLFRGTARDNLTFFDHRISDHQIRSALDELGLIDWVRLLPNGLNTPLGVGGAGLSAGESQLFALARVFLKDPGVIILDEASSRLDPLTEQLLERAISRLLENRTGIVIAHRLSTVERADSILIVERGRVREHGGRQRLAADSSSRFSELLRVGWTDGAT